MLTETILLYKMVQFHQFHFTLRHPLIFQTPWPLTTPTRGTILPCWTLWCIRMWPNLTLSCCLTQWCHSSNLVILSTLLVPIKCYTSILLAHLLRRKMTEPSILLKSKWWQSNNSSRVSKMRWRKTCERYSVSPSTAQLEGEGHRWDLQCYLCYCHSSCLYSLWSH